METVPTAALSGIIRPVIAWTACAGANADAAVTTDSTSPSARAIMRCDYWTRRRPVKGGRMRFARLAPIPRACQGNLVKALVCDVSVPRQVVTALLGRLDKRFFFGPFSPAALTEIPDPVLPADDWVVIATKLC